MNKIYLTEGCKMSEEIIMEEEWIHEEKPHRASKVQKENTKELNRDSAKEAKELKMEKLSIQDLPGVGAATAEKLESAGYRDLMSIAVATLGELVETAGVTEA